MALELNIDGVDRVSILIHETLEVNQTSDGLNSTCKFDLIDEGTFTGDPWTVGLSIVEGDDVIGGAEIVYPDPDTKVEVSVVDGATVYFAGILSRVTITHIGRATRILSCECHDFNALLEESVVDALEEYGAATDEEIIDDIFTKYVTDIDFATHVSGGYAFAEIAFENVTVRQVLDTLAAQSECIWYVDYSKKLHYATAEDNAPAWWLSENPDQVNSFSFFDDIEKGIDATNLVNRVFVVGGTAALWFQDAASIAEHGLHQAIIKDTSIVGIVDLEARGDAILAKFKDPIATLKLKTYKDGLRAGMHVRVVNALYDISDTFLINNLTISFPVDGSPVYEITCGGLVSSGAGAARRLELDRLQKVSGLLGGSDVVLAGRGWGHDLVFSATDDDTVAWTAGTLTSSGGDEFDIDAGNTDDPGAMAAKTIVYLDTAISLTKLYMTTNELAAIGNNRIMVAVCWPSGVAGVDAGFQVFGASSDGVQTYLNADNIAADCIIANHIAANTITAAKLDITELSAIDSNMGILVSGTINMFTDTWDVDATGFRLNATEIASQNAGVDQVIISAATGKFTAGGGAVILDATGIRILNTGDAGASEKVKFYYDDAGTERGMGQVYSNWGGGGGDHNTTWLTAWRQAGDPWPEGVDVVLAAIDYIAGKDVRISVHSTGQIKATACTDFKINDGARDVIRLTGGDAEITLGDAAGAKKLKVRDSGLYDVFVVDSDGNLETEFRCEVGARIGTGLHVGTLATAPTDNDISCDGTIKTAGNVEWNLSGYNHMVVTDTGYVVVYVGGVEYHLLAKRP